MNQTVWAIVIVVAIAVVLALVALMMRRRVQRPYEIHTFPQDYISPYEQRIEEVERMFVNQPREAVAAAKLLVDDMLTRMGHPVRMSGEERVRDLRRFNREHAGRYRLGSDLKKDPTTEEMRRALKAYLDTARDLIGDARRHFGNPKVEEPARRREIAG